MGIAFRENGMDEMANLFGRHQHTDTEPIPATKRGAILKNRPKQMPRVGCLGTAEGPQF
jgi:hypothetical protein